MQISVRQQDFIRFAIFHLVAATFLFWIFDRMGPMDDMRAVLDHGVRTTGSVVSTDCPNHGRINYQFSAKDGPMTGAIRSSDLHLGACADVRIGVIVDVHYLASAPSKNFAGNIAAHVSDQMWIDFFIATVVTGMFVWGYFSRRVLVDTD